MESDHELAFSETVSNLRRGKTNYVVVDVINDTKKEMKLTKGLVMGSVHSVSAVMPLVNLGGNVQQESKNAVQVASVEVKENNRLDGESEEKEITSSLMATT